jgi:hypothetical protein
MLFHLCKSLILPLGHGYWFSWLQVCLLHRFDPEDHTSLVEDTCASTALFADMQFSTQQSAVQLRDMVIVMFLRG